MPTGARDVAPHRGAHARRRSGRHRRSSRLAATAASARVVTRRLICSSEDAIEESSDSSEGSRLACHARHHRPIGAAPTGIAAARAAGTLPCMLQRLDLRAGAPGVRRRAPTPRPRGPGPGRRGPRHRRGREATGRRGACASTPPVSTRPTIDEIRVSLAEIDSAARAAWTRPCSKRSPRRPARSSRSTATGLG